MELQTEKTFSGFSYDVAPIARISVFFLDGKHEHIKNVDACNIYGDHLVVIQRINDKMEKHALVFPLSTIKSYKINES